MRRLAAVVAIILLAACRRETHASPPAAPQQTAAAQPEHDFASLPSRDKYAGSEVCRDCHAAKYERWSHDFHAKALGEATTANLVAKFDDAHFAGQSSEAWMSTKSGKPVMRTRNREGQLVDYPVQWVIGAKRMQDAVTVFDDGRWQVLPVYFHITGKPSWVDYNEAKQGKVDAAHPYFWTNFKRTANKECLECHATGVDLRYDRASHQWSTSFADAGVACEACHGPAARHAETKAKSDVLRADHLDAERQLAICARCHGPREPLFPLLDAHDQFRPGERYADRFTPLVVTDGTERSGEYFADGRPSSSSFEYQALIQSRCFLRGGATCLTCHDAPHGDNNAANELRDRDPNASCVKCHAGVAPHSRHAASVTCVDCHMPKVLSGVLDKFADHALDVPNLDTTIRHGVPNACGVCHADRSTTLLAQTAAQWWPQLAARNARRSQLADAIDEKTATTSLSALEAVTRDASEAPILRGAAAVLVAQRFPRNAPAILIPLLHERDATLRAKAIEALGYANARDAADAIAPLVDDAALPVRQLAAIVLASWGDERGRAAAEKLAHDPATSALMRPHIVVALAAANRGDYDAALRDLDALLANTPYNVDALVLEADVDMRRGDRAGARAALEEALRFNPSHRGATGRMRAIAAGQ